jgi:hypothetical protein
VAGPRSAFEASAHKTRSVFERYNITSEKDLADAARKLDAATGKARNRVASAESFSAGEPTLGPAIF